MILVHTNESKEILKKFEELWSKTRDLISSITKNSDNYDEKHMKIRFNLDKRLPLNNTIETHSIIKFARPALYENDKYYPQVFLDECLHKL